MTDQAPRTPFDTFKWSCLAAAILAAIGLGWMLNDLRATIKQSVTTVDENLPAILASTKKSTETLAVLSEDIKQLRDLAGVSGEARDRSLVVYADKILDLVEESGAQIGLEKKLFGSGLKDLEPAAEWVVAARKEAVWLSFRAKSKSELLQALTRNKYGSDWYVQIDDNEPQRLLDWLAQRDAETAELRETLADED